jgi:hypothetical protein
MPGLVPGIHVFDAREKGVDGPDKPGHDDVAAHPTLMPGISFIALPRSIAVRSAAAKP